MLPIGGQEISPWVQVGKVVTPFAGGGLGEPERFAVGDADVRMVQEPVHVSSLSLQATRAPFSAQHDSDAC